MELDNMYDGAATHHYVNHIIQNWSKSPFHRGTYSEFRNSAPEILGESVDDKLFFAGEAYNTSGDGDYAYIHAAARAAYGAFRASHYSYDLRTIHAHRACGALTPR
ncbi:MAG: hypothetical protein AAF492_08960, partial [Verrucomicrobiota bacterium]